MKSILHIALLTLGVIGSISSQKLQSKNSIVKLKNGIIYIGEIIEDNGNSARILLLDGNEVNANKKDYDSFLSGDNIIVHDNGKYHVKQGRLFNLTLGFNPSNEESNPNARMSTHISLLWGYHFNRKYALAAGLGFEFNEAKVSGFQFDTQFLPMFVYGRYYLSHGKPRFFMYGKLGYGFKANDETFEDEHTGGYQFQFGGGIHMASKRKTKLIMSLGLHHQKTEGTERFIDPFGSEINTVYDIWIRRMIFSIGYEFNKHK